MSLFLGERQPVDAKRTAPIRVDSATHTAISMAALSYSARVGRRLTLAQIVSAALRVAERHDVDMIAALAPGGGEQK
jgi:hypothetical protein